MKAIDKNAPVKSSMTINIKASAAKTWQVLSDIDNWVNWQEGINKSCLNGELKPGTDFIWKADGIKIHSILHTVEPYKRIGWTGKAIGTYAIHNYTLTEENGITIIFVEESLNGFLPRLLKKSFQKNLENGMKKGLKLLKTKCENQE